MRYRVTFDRIGRHSGRPGCSLVPAPLEVTTGGTVWGSDTEVDALAEAVVGYAHRYLGSSQVAMVITDTTRPGIARGYLGVGDGGLRSGGDFTIEATA